MKSNALNKNFKYQIVFLALLIFNGLPQNGQITITESYNKICHCEIFTLKNDSHDTTYCFENYGGSLKDSCFMLNFNVVRDSILNLNRIWFESLVTSEKFHWLDLWPQSSIQYCIHYNENENINTVVNLYIGALKMEHTSRRYRKKKIRQLEGEYRSYTVIK